MDFKLAVMVLVVIFNFTGALAGQTGERRAVVVLSGPSPSVKGIVTFTQKSINKYVKVEGTIEGLAPGYHGFHVHDKGDLSNGCTSTLGHFNPENRTHGGPTSKTRHVGDLGNILADDNGIATVSLKDRKICLFGKNKVVGRGLVVHAEQDDLGLGGQTDSTTTGHAGARIACGVIGWQ